jgi:hypothetical protein
MKTSNYDSQSKIENCYGFDLSYTKSHCRHHQIKLGSARVQVVNNLAVSKKIKSTGDSDEP